jgi:hypothetical protein
MKVRRGNHFPVKQTLGATAAKWRFVRKADLYASRSEGPVSALRVGCYSRPKADVSNNHSCCDAASLKRTLIDRAAFAQPEDSLLTLFADTTRLNL